MIHIGSADAGSALLEGGGRGGGRIRIFRQRNYVNLRKSVREIAAAVPEARCERTPTAAGGGLHCLVGSGGVDDALTGSTRSIDGGFNANGKSLVERIEVVHPNERSMLAKISIIAGRQARGSPPEAGTPTFVREGSPKSTPNIRASYVLRL